MFATPPAIQRPLSAASAADARSAPGTRLHQLKSQIRQPGEASFFYYNAHFGSDAVKLLPGEYFVHHEDMLLLTTLGSCIAVCLWDRQARVGGMNHFMLPDNSAESGRYGPFAMEMLINALMKQGAQRMTLEAKVFGGAHVLNSIAPDSIKVGPRTVCFLPHSGKAMLKRLTTSSALALEAQAREDALRTQSKRSGAGVHAGSVDLF
jgi:chemotaxis protein CheD